MKHPVFARLVCGAVVLLSIPVHAERQTPPGREDLACRPAIPQPAAGQTDRRIAITLAGGGTKASSFALGVLSAAVTTPLALSADRTRYSDTLFWQSDAVSSVSGGSYAAFYLYSRLIRNRPTTAATPTVLDQSRELTHYFEDCIPYKMFDALSGKKGLIAAEAAARGVSVDTLFCPQPVLVGDNDGSEDYATKQAAARRYWNETRPATRNLQFVRCHADILTWQRCEFQDTPAANHRSDSADAALVTVHMLSLPMAWVANTLFDWPINLSPSRMVYREGIGMAYGLEPLDARALEGDVGWAAQVGAVKHFVTDDGRTELSGRVSGEEPDRKRVGVADPDGELRLRPNPERMTFAGLNSLYGDGPHSPPRWIINATAAPSRSLLGWTGQNDTNFERDIFHMTGDQQCAGGVGPIAIDKAFRDVKSVEKHASLLTAVNASAAFFDANQRVVGQPGRFLVGLGLHVANLNWGIDALNVDESGEPKSSPIRRGIHLALPFPLYLGESFAAYKTEHAPVYVRLVDGGSSDNLGAYRPIVESVKDVIVSDHAQDKGGSMGDLCLLRNELLIRRGLHLHIPGLAGWPQGCYDDHVLRRSRVDSDATPAARTAFCKLEKTACTLDADQKPRALSYPIWGWPYPFLAGCVSDSADPDSCLRAPQSRLWIVKPAFDYPAWRRDQSEENGKKRVIVSCGGVSELPCESSALLARLLKKGEREYFNEEWSTPIFPQDSTVKMTINSNAELVGAYRELGRHYTKIAIDALDRSRAPGGDAHFAKLLCWQAKHPIVGVAVENELGLAESEPLDLKIKGWSLKERDAARLTGELPADVCTTLGLPVLQAAMPPDLQDSCRIGLSEVKASACRPD